MKLKVLIADDERPIREWIIMCLSRLDIPLEIVGAANGKEAYDLCCATVPDVIITDIRMPLMDGFQLMEEVKKHYDNIVFVILTCHEEFKFARKAIQLGAEDYLLKTEIDENQLQQIFMKLQESRRKVLNKEDIFIERQTFIQGILHHGLIPDEKRLNQLGLFPEHRDYFIMAIKVSAKNTLYESQREFCVEGYRCVYFPYDKNIVIALVWTSRSNSMLVQLNEIVNFADCAAAFFGGVIGISKIYGSVADFPNAIQGAMMQLEKGFYRSGNCINLELLQPERPKDKAVQKEVEDILRQVYVLPKEELCNRILNWITKVREVEYASSERLKEDCLLILNRMKEKYSILEFDRKEISNAQSYEMLKKMILGCVGELRSVENLHVRTYIRDAVDYIEEHYAQECSLEMVAGKVGLNPEYFSRLFKENMNQTFNLYLTGVRIKAAKQLLTDSSKSISEVALSVGYQNIAYFSRVFKKYTGNTPFNYKK